MRAERPEIALQLGEREQEAGGQGVRETVGWGRGRGGGAADAEIGPDTGHSETASDSPHVVTNSAQG